jgi:putative phosphoesterase
VKVAVVSDTHDALSKIEEFASKVNSIGVELVIHCGDFVSPFAVKLLLSRIKCEFLGVFGNNDGEIAGLLKVSGGLIEKPPVVREICGKRVAVMHEPLFVESLARSGDFDFILYGHTHEAVVKEINGCYIVNPGELSGYITGRSSFAILELTQPKVEIVWV